jgi:nucleoside-triphosphatase THEP1
VFQRMTALVEQAQAGGATHVNVNLDKSFKGDLTSNIKSAQPKMKVEYLAGVQKKSPVVNELSGPVNDGLFQGINSIDQNTKDTFRLRGAIGELLGDLETYKLAMSLEGDQGAGKTQFAFQLADAFADIGYSVGMFELEIGANSNIVTRFRDKYIHPDNQDKVAIAGEAPNGIDTVREYARKFDVIIIDSWTKLDVDSQEFDKLRNDFEDTVWIVLFQRTSGNKIRGGTKPLYDAGINLEAIKEDDTFVNNYVKATKSRYGQTGIKYNISKMKITA